MTVRKNLVILIIALISVSLIAVGTHVVGQPVAQDVTPTAAPLTDQSSAAAPTQTTTTSEISALGSVEAASVMELYFQTSGTINGVYAQVGDCVRAGDVLADLDASSAWNTYNQAMLKSGKRANLDG